MSLIIDGNKNISATRGDTHTISLTPYLNGTPYTISINDTIRFTVRKHPKEDGNDTDFIFQKVSHIDEITILPADTQDLSYTTYYYDIEFEFSTGIILTPVEWKKFVLGKEAS